MIKARAGNLIIFGLDEENIKRLKNNQPIKINGKEMGLEDDIIIFYKPTMGDLIKSLQPYLGEDTAIHDTLD